MHVIGAGLGRTGTYSLKLALNRLGLGPCHHMEEVLIHKDTQVSLWDGAARGQVDWPAIYAGYASAVDWPTAGFFRELNAAYPKAKFILTTRSAESWLASFTATIYTLLAAGDMVPPDMRAWHDMAVRVIQRTGFPGGLDEAELGRRFTAHHEAVLATVPSDRLLVFQVKDGWQPLCAFLGLPVPDEPFPRTNDRAEFWDRVSGKG